MLFLASNLSIVMWSFKKIWPNMDVNRRSRLTATIGLLALLSLPVSLAAGANVTSPTPSLDQGFQLLYQLNFPQAHQVFAAWQQEHPDDPLGPACEAAGLLFSEFDRLGVLESQFYENDRTFETRKKLVPDTGVRDRFAAAVGRAESQAQTRLGQNANDRDALFAMTLASGLKADYAALIEKHNLISLHFTREATRWARQLLTIDPKCYDAHLATGVSQYIIGSIASPIRWLARIGGLTGTKAGGIEELRLTAQQGRYLAPFARILLAIAYVRDNDKPRAREMLVSLEQDFPQNPLFAREIGRLDAER
jgi:hypothetical protein